jgi:hypothetical protein
MPCVTLPFKNNRSELNMSESKSCGDGCRDELLMKILILECKDQGVTRREKYHDYGILFKKGKGRLMVWLFVDLQTSNAPYTAACEIIPGLLEIEVSKGRKCNNSFVLSEREARNIHVSSFS